MIAVEQAVAAPPATGHLADLGARVVKVERPDGGDFARGYDDLPMGPVPALGERTAPVLRGLGCSDERVAQLRGSGVLGE
ncbi:crotonobetainyl-CoA:carnitine CoA-transferase CaiB-like acyl-CoA transferase [Kitasatospora sp. GP30]|nr:crotonobetainyl-CoA:carnitine CoA-transferase CaiB-like acyl-CoA transferase [Kitasatospora sp. GP30]